MIVIWRNFEPSFALNGLKCNCLLLVSLIAFEGFAQFGDIARVDYTILPQSDSGIEYTRIRALFNYPLKLKKEGTYLFLGLDYSNINLSAKNSDPFDTDELSDFQLLDLNIGYTMPLKNDWRLGARFTPGISSNLTASHIGFEDIVLSGDLIFIKDRTKSPEGQKRWRLIWGLSYSGNRGFPFPLPFLSYYKKFHPDWSYNLGIPKSNLQYHISKKHRLKLYTELDGFTSNLQGGILTDSGEMAESINLALIVGGLQYEFHIIDHVEFYARFSYVLSDRVNLRNENKDDIEILDNSNILYLRTGIKLKI